MILCWGEAHASAIHDHADSHCFMKMLKGELTEVRYAWPHDTTVHSNDNVDISKDDESVDEYNGDELQETGRSTLEVNGVAYINGNLLDFSCFFFIFLIKSSLFKNKRQTRTTQS